MRVYRILFGKNNWAWQLCLDRDSIAVMDPVELHNYWIKRDKEGYVTKAMQLYQGNQGTYTGWYNTTDKVLNSSNDIWTHIAGEYLWWTTSGNTTTTPEIIDDPEPLRKNDRVYIYFKKCTPWRNTDLKGQPLLLKNIHPKALSFFRARSTCAEISEDNAAFAMALIKGESLSVWENRKDWIAKANEVAFRKLPIPDAWNQATLRMANTAYQTCKQSGKDTTLIYKSKLFCFDSIAALKSFADGLLHKQGWKCALTRLNLEGDYSEVSSDFACSLDRIDSSGPYAEENLQIVCKFVNKWKSDTDNDKFKALINSIIEAHRAQQSQDSLTPSQPEDA